MECCFIWFILIKRSNCNIIIIVSGIGQGRILLLTSSRLSLAHTFQSTSLSQTTVQMMAKITGSLTLPHYLLANLQPKISTEMETKSQKIKLGHIFKSMCILPHRFNVLGGLSPFFIPNTGVKITELKSTLNFSYFSIPILTIVLQSFLGLAYNLFHFWGSPSPTKEFTAPIGYETGGAAEQFVHILLNSLGVFSQLVVRIVYISLHSRFLKFHQDLETHSYKIVGTQNETGDLEHFTKIQRYLKKVLGFGVGYWFIVAVLMSILSTNFNFGGSFVADKDPERKWKLVTVWILGTVFGLANGIFTLHCVWFALYIKWMETLFKILTEKSKPLLEKVKSNVASLTQGIDLELKAETLLDESKVVETKLVREFNGLFQFPIVVWLFCLCAGITTQLFFVLNWMNKGYYYEACFFGFPISCELIALIYISHVGSTFEEKVELIFVFS